MSVSSGRRFGLSDKNVPNTCCTDIKTKNGRDSDCGEKLRKWNYCSRRQKKLLNAYIVQGHPTKIFGKYLFGRPFEI